MKALYLLLLIILPSLAFAQTNATVDANKIHFRTLAWENSLSDIFFSQVPPPLPDPQHPTQSLPPDPDFKEKPVYIPFKFRSLFTACDKSKPIYFIRHVGALYKIVATVDLSNTGDAPLLFFQASTSDNLSVTVIPDDKVTFPGGSVRLMNFSSIPLTASFNQTAVQLNPYTNKVVVPGKVPGKLSFFQLVRTSDGVCQYSNPWSGDTSQRTILFIVDDKKRPQNVAFVMLAEPMTATTPIVDIKQ